MAVDREPQKGQTNKCPSTSSTLPLDGRRGAFFNTKQMPNPWFKFYGSEYLGDPKIVSLTADERSCWLTLLCLASQGENGEIKYLKEHQLLALSGVQQADWDKNSGILAKFMEQGMIVIVNDGLTVINWTKRQMSESYERVKRFKDKQKINTALTAVTTEREEDLLSHSNKTDIISFFEDPSKITTELIERGLPEQTIKQEITKFISYWTEPNSTGKKQRWQLEPTFEIKRRLATWFSRSSQFKNNKERTRKIWNPNT